MALKNTVKRASAKTTAKSKSASKPAVKKASQPAKSASTKALTKKSGAPEKIDKLTGEQLVVENLSTLSSLVGTISETLDILVQKVENMAYHLIATEETLAEVVATTGVDLAQVNKRIRSKIAAGTGKSGDPNRAIDVAAAIASPLPRTKN